MAVRKYQVPVGNVTSTLEVDFNLFAKRMPISLDGSVISEPTYSELKKGIDHKLTDGSRLTVRMVKVGAAPIIQIVKDGHPIEGSPGHPLQIVRLAYGVLLFLGILNIATATLTMGFGIEILAKVGFGPYNAVVGGIDLICYFRGRKRNSYIELAVALAVFLVDSLAMLNMLIVLRQTQVVGSTVFIRFMFISALYRGLGAAWKIRGKGLD